jgi:hypothetical protein
MAPEASAAAAASYNVDAYWREVNRSARRAWRGASVRVGMPAPGFRLPTVGGGTADLDELRRDGTVLVVFGCHSAPPVHQELPLIDRMLADRADDVRAVLVYTREIHPNEELAYGTFPHHSDAVAKEQAATRFKDDLGLGMTVAVDDLAGTVHSAYGELPFNAVVVDSEGIVVHREEWASVESLALVLDNQTRGRERAARGKPPRISLTETLWYCERLDRKA